MLLHQHLKPTITTYVCLVFRTADEGNRSCIMYYSTRKPLQESGSHARACRDKHTPTTPTTTRKANPTGENKEHTCVCSLGGGTVAPPTTNSSLIHIIPIRVSPTKDAHIGLISKYCKVIASQQLHRYRMSTHAVFYPPLSSNRWKSSWL